MKRCLLFALLLSACTRPPEAPAPPANPAPRPPALSPAVDIVRLDLPAEGQEPRRVVAVVAQPDQVRVKVVASALPWRTAAAVAETMDALAVINGGYFDPQNRPMGLIVSDGSRLNELRRTDWPIFAVEAGRPRIVDRRAARLEHIEQALQCGPRLVRDGRPVRLKESPPRARSAVGLDAAGRVVLAATERGGLTLAELADLLARPRERGGLGCVDAMNLDGGPSTQLAVPGQVDILGGYPMPSHIVLLPRP